MATDADAPVQACSLAGAAEQAGDCDDADADRSPGADEVCDDIDNDCDDEVDESAVDATTYYVMRMPMIRKRRLPAPAKPPLATQHRTAIATTPAGPSVLDAEEVCDLLDNDCDGSTDEDPVDGDTFYADFDRDGSACATTPMARSPARPRRRDCDAGWPTPQGQRGLRHGRWSTWTRSTRALRPVPPATRHHGDLNTTEAAARRRGFIAIARDCDDSSADVSPAQVEVCDRIDNDCNGVIDECGGNKFYRDADGDGFGDPSTEIDGCFAPEGYVTDRNDCDDTNPDLFPETQSPGRRRQRLR